MNLVVLASMVSKIGAGLFVLTCVLLIGIILLQKGRGGGLSGAFGGAGGGHSAFGAKTGDVLTWATVALATLFLLLAVAMNFVYRGPKVVPQQPPAQQPATSDEGMTAPTQPPPDTAPEPEGSDQPTEDAAEPAADQGQSPETPPAQNQDTSP